MAESADAMVEVEVIRLVADSVPAMLAYWDSTQRCRFASQSYETWFGVKPAALIGRTLKELLGPIYPLNLPYIEGALRGERQEFEREIPDPHGGPPRYSLAVYTPHVVEGRVKGFSVLVSDISHQKKAELELRSALTQIKTLAGLLPVCAWCGKIRDGETWTTLEAYVLAHSEARISHGMCNTCFAKADAEGL